MLTTVWGSLAPTVAALITTHPDLGRRLALSPSWAIHATAAYIHAMIASGCSLTEIAREIARHPPRRLLSQAVRDKHVRLASTLKRVGVRVHDLGFYDRLNTLLRGVAAEVILEAEKISPDLLNVAEAISAEPVLLAAHRTLNGSEPDVRSLLSLLSYLRAMGLARNIEALPSGSGWKAILRRVSSDLARASTPEPPFAAPTGWHFVTTIGELLDVGKRMGNCVGGFRYGGNHHMVGLITGKSLLLTTSAEPPMLAAISSAGPSLWAVSEVSIRGPRNSLGIERERFVRELAAAATQAGHVLFDECPLNTLSNMSWRADEQFDDEEEHDEAA